MTASESKSLKGLGFLAVVEQPTGDLFGGLLVLNLQGRPLEFHCTAPVRANRAQQILYGPTLEPYLYGEQIGPALAASCTTDVSLFLVNSPAMAALRDHVDAPVAWVEAAVPPADGGANGDAPAGWVEREICGQRLWIVPRSDDVERVELTLSRFDVAMDLAESLERVRAALREAQRSAA